MVQSNQRREVMSNFKFKVGDKAVRTKGDFGDVFEGDVVFVTGLDEYGHLKVDDSTRLTHNPDYYELYKEEVSLDLLTPLQAAEALLNGDNIEYQTSKGDWEEYRYGLNTQLNILNKRNFRLKPKTVIINGIEVPAPLPKKPNQEFIYFINIFKNKVYQLPTEKLTFNHQYYWGTKEDAQKVLDAMVLPFKNIDKGEK